MSFEGWLGLIDVLSPIVGARGDTGDKEAKETP